MEIIVQKISKEQYKSFVEASDQFSFWQTSAMGERRKVDGWDYELLGFFDNENIIGAGLFYKREVLLNRFTYECLGGPIMDYTQAEVILNALSKYLVNNNAYDCIINPNLTAYEHNVEEAVKEMKNNYEQVKQVMNDAGFIYQADADKNDLLMNWFYKKDISNFDSVEQLLESYERETRRLTNNSLKNPLVLEELTKDELPRLEKLVNMTADNKDFASRSIEYYETLQAEYNKEHEAKMVIIKLDVKKYRNELNAIVSDLEAKIKADIEINTKRSNNRATQNQDVLNATQAKLDSLADVKSEFVDLCGGVFLYTPTTVTYLIGGSNKNYFSFHGPQFMQYSIMSDAIKRGLKVYDFYGTRGSYVDRPEEDGVYFFKRGFSGQLYENFGYYIYEGNSFKDKIIRKIKQIRK